MLSGVALAAVTVLGAAITPAAPAARATAVRVVVAATPGASVAGLADTIARRGGTVERVLPAARAVVADMSDATRRALASRADVRTITPDGPVHLAHAVDGFDGSADAGSLYTTAWLSGARDAWSRGVTGRGIDVALIDSGVTPVAGLDAPGKLVHGPDLSFDSQSPELRHLDGYGHGTHMAGIIAARDSNVSDAALPTDHDDVAGIAPGARIVSVKVADRQGATDVSQLLAAIDWVVQHRDTAGLHIRVLNLSFGTDSVQDARVDPLAYAAENAWNHGIVVVAAAGNHGATAGRLSDPAIDPFLIAVGAADAAGTPARSDDTVTGFSSWGDGMRDPDLVAPGRSIASLRVPGSALDLAHPEGRVGTRLFRGSGTSQAAAVVSGAAALLLDAHPALSPDQVKEMLTGTARSLKETPVRAQGHGLVAIDDALFAPVPLFAGQPFVGGSGNGSLDGARGSLHLERDGVVLDGERDIFGHRFDSGAWAASSTTATAWDGGDWNGSTWSGSTWSGSTWSSAQWSGSTWSGSTWSGSTWSGSTWSSAQWTGSTWSGSGWAPADRTVAATEGWE